MDIKTELPKMDVKTGQIVTFKPEYQDPGDSDIVFIATEDSIDGYVRVEAQVNMAFKPIQEIGIYMIATVRDA